MSPIDKRKQACIWLNEVDAEWERAQELHAPIQTVHEAAAVIREEYDEFWDEVKRKKHDPVAMRKELTQIAAMCLRAVIDLNLE